MELFVSPDFKLCYIDNNTAYFTTQELSEQWGDDWDDAPYEHNAGEPYEPSRPDLADRAVQFPNSWNADGTPKWSIMRIMFDGNFDTPASMHSNSPYSVEKINAGAIAWLTSSTWGSSPKVSIPAGVGVEAFIDLIKKGGGDVYLPSSWFGRPEKVISDKK